MNKILLTCTIFFLFANTLKSQVRITMLKEGGVYTTPCTVNGLRLRFIFDTGASNVSLSLSEAIFMLKNGYLDKEDLHGSSYSQIANGDVVENTTVNLKELEIGGIKIYDVDATIIHELSAPLLLGQSAIQKLGKIQIENYELLIMSLDSPSSDKACAEAIMLAEKAEKYYFDELYSLSSETYQRVYDICPNAIDCFGIYLLGNSYYTSENYPLAIKYLEKASKCEPDSQLLMFIHENIAASYCEIKSYESAISNYQKALSYTKEDRGYYHLNSSLGFIKKIQEKFIQSNEYYIKSLTFLLKMLSASNNDVMSGKIKDNLLGEIYWNMGTNYFQLQEKKKSENYIIKSALCGYETAKEYCKEFDLKYELYIE